MRDPLGLETYREMQLLHEIAQTPHVTQRDLAKRVGTALGMTNLMLRRLAAKGFIQIVNTNRSRTGYLITDSGTREKARLTREFIRSSLSLYGRIRHLLQEEFSTLRRPGAARVILCGTDELAEVASVTMQEMGLHLVGVVSPAAAERSDFLGNPIRQPAEFNPQEYDWVVVVSLKEHGEILRWLTQAGIPEERILDLSFQGLADSGGSARQAGPRAAEEGPRLPAAPDPSSVDVVILCGGKGTRLGSLTAHTPKPLLQVDRHPFLLHLLMHLKGQGFSRFILAAHYLAEQFETFLAGCRAQIPSLELVVELSPLGTGGALRQAVERVRSSTLIAVNGDTWCPQPLLPVLEDHQRVGRVFTVVAVPAPNVEGGAHHKGVWHVGAEGNVEGFATEETVSEGWVNGGLYILDRAMVRSWPEGRYSLEENLPALLNGKEAGVFCSSSRLLDIGTPQTYEQAVRILPPMETPVGVGEEPER